MTDELISKEHIKKAKDLDKAIELVAKVGELFADYKLGDIFVCEQRDWNSTDKWNVEKSLVGTTHKYMVCHVSATGIPYLRKLTGKGKPTGEAIIPTEVAPFDLNRLLTLGRSHTEDWRFKPDPEQLDAILLQEEFDPVAAQREATKLFNEINKYNKSIAIKTGAFQSGAHQNVTTFFKSLTPGDKFWMGYDKAYVFQGMVKTKGQFAISAVDQSQQAITFTINDFISKRLYRAAPRSFAKEKVP